MRILSVGANRKCCRRQPNNTESPVCSSFPGRYIPRPSLPVTEIVCISTQMPPKDNSPQQITNRSPSLETVARSTQPFASSSIPVMHTCSHGGRSHNTQRFRKQMITRLIMTQPQICAIIDSDFFSTCGNESRLEGWISAFIDCFPGRSAAVMTALKI